MIVKLFCNDGLGGCLTTYGAAKLISKAIGEIKVQCYFCCSDIVFKTLEYFEPEFVDQIFHVSENWYSENHKLNIRDSVYNLTPNLFDGDGLFFTDTGLNWRQLKQERSLDTVSWEKCNKSVCLAFSTAQENNNYPFLNQLIKNLCQKLPNIQFYYPYIKNWSGKNLEHGFNLNDFVDYNNLNIYEPKNMAEDLDMLRRECQHFIGVDNGVMNFAYHCNKERWLIDSRFNNPEFYIRWRQNGDESIPINISPTKFCNAFYLAYKNPHLNGLSKSILLDLAENNIDIY